MPDKSENKVQVKNEILGAAMRLVMNNGIRRTSLADIAMLAKVSKGTLYYYYPSKQELILDIANQYIRDFTDILYAWVDSLNKEQDTGAATERLILAITENEQGLRLFIVLCCEAALGNSPLNEKLIFARREWKVLMDVGFLKLPACTRLRSAPDIFLTLLDGLCLETLLGTAPNIKKAAGYAAGYATQ